MNTVYLKHGDYRVKVVVGPNVWWKSFSVGEEAYEIQCDFLKNQVRNLNIKANAYDAETNEDISALAKTEVLYKNKWVSLESIQGEKLESGTVWKIKVSAQGYTEEIFSLLIDWYQDNLIVSAALKKEAVTEQNSENNSI